MVVSEPDDPCEREADQVADAVTSVSSGGTPASMRLPATRPVVRSQPKEGALYRAVSTACVAPSEIVTVPAASLFGDAAEAIIIFDYCGKLGCRPMATDHFDNRVFGAMSYIAFLAAHNPTLGAAQVVQLAILSQIELNRPDILTHVPARQEFYEIKPDSPSGRIAGTTKVGWLGVFYPHWSLPYIPGVTYVPTPEIMIASGHVGPWPLEVFLGVRRLAPGLVVYGLCVRGELAKIGLAALLAILAAIVVILSRGKVRIPIPLPTPGPLPVPAATGAALLAAGTGIAEGDAAPMGMSEPSSMLQRRSANPHAPSLTSDMQTEGKTRVVQHGGMLGAKDA